MLQTRSAASNCKLQELFLRFLVCLFLPDYLFGEQCLRREIEMRSGSERVHEELAGAVCLGCLLKVASNRLLLAYAFPLPWVIRLRLVYLFVCTAF